MYLREELVDVPRSGYCSDRNTGRSNGSFKNSRASMRVNETLPFRVLDNWQRVSVQSRKSCGSTDFLKQRGL